MRSVFALLTSALVLTAALQADQYAYVKPAVAQEAVRLLSAHDYLLELCEPCGDTTGEVLVVTRVDEADVNYEGFHEVRVNDRGVDLAYIFYKDGNVWKNAAIALGLSPHSVSAEVPAAAVAQIPQKKRVQNTQAPAKKGNPAK